MDPGLTDAFEANRGRLKRLAYRMLGSVSEAEDAVQDAWIRWRRAPADVADPAAWLVRATTRLCLDRLRAAKVEREAYKGPWLPEPLIEPLTEDPVEKAEEVSVAFLLALERLSPLERAVFLLHDVFDQDYAEVAQTLERSEAAVRQLASRAREHVREARPRFTPARQPGAGACSRGAAAVHGGSGPCAAACGRLHGRGGARRHERPDGPAGAGCDHGHRWRWQAEGGPARAGRPG